MNSSSRLPLLMVIASAILWGMYGTFLTALMNLGLNRDGLILTRFAVTAFSMGLLILATDRSHFKLNKKDLPLFAANGLLSLLFFICCYSEAIRITKVATAAALLYTAPAIVMVLSALLFKEKMTPTKILSCILAVAGCAFASGIAGELFSESGAAPSLPGILCGLGSGLGYALYSIFSRMILNRGYSVYTNIFYSFSIGAVGRLLMSLYDGSIFTLTENLPGFALSVLCMLLTGPLAYFLYTSGMQHMETSRAARLASIEPVTAAILGSLLLHQPLSGWEILGIAMVILSVILSGG